MLFSKKRFMLGATVALFSATTVLAQEDDDNLQPLRTHSIYMPYIGKLAFHFFVLFSLRLSFGQKKRDTCVETVRWERERKDAAGHLCC